MFPFYPIEEIYDETAESCAGRWFLMSGFRKYEDFVRVAYGRKVDWKSLDVAGVAEVRLKSGLFVPADRFVQEQTLQPFMRRFLAGELQARAVVSDRATIAERYLSQGRRFCPVCCNEQLEEKHVSVWLRMHNLPGVTTCRLHFCQLIEFKNRAIGARPRLDGNWAEAIGAATATETWYAEQAWTLLQSAATDACAHRTRQAVLAMLKLRHPSLTGERFDAARMEECLLDTFPANHLHRLGFGKTARYHAVRGIDGSDLVLNPVSVLVLMRAAGIQDVRELMAMSANMVVPPPRPESERSKKLAKMGPRKRKWHLQLEATLRKDKQKKIRNAASSGAVVLV